MKKNKNIDINSRKLHADVISNIDIGDRLKDITNMQKTIKDDKEEKSKEE